MKRVQNHSSPVLGKHTLPFIPVSIIHRAKGSMTFDSTHQAPFSGGALCRPGPPDVRKGRADEGGPAIPESSANMAGPGGAEEAAALDIPFSCPLYGPVLRENLSDFNAR